MYLSVELIEHCFTILGVLGPILRYRHDALESIDSGLGQGVGGEDFGGMWSLIEYAEDEDHGGCPIACGADVSHAEVVRFHFLIA